MPDTTLPVNDTPITDANPQTEEEAQEALDELALEEEIEEELIIEDFTIDGICGVY